MLNDVTFYTRVISIVGDILKVEASGVGLGDLAFVEDRIGDRSLAQVIEIRGRNVSLQVFTGGKGLSTDARVQFLGHPFQVTYSENILGRIFDGSGEPVDGGPELISDPHIPIVGPSVNPV